MFQVKKQFEAGGYQVVIENTESGYRHVGEHYPVHSGQAPGLNAENGAKADADVQDWVVKFLAAGIRAEMVS